MKEFVDLREAEAEELEYDVKWTDDLSARVSSISRSSVITLAKAKILKKDPHLSHSKYASDWKQTPSVEVVDDTVNEINITDLADKISNYGSSRKNIKKAYKTDALKAEIEGLRKRLDLLNRELKNSSLNKRGMKLKESPQEEISMMKQQLNFIKLASLDITDFVKDCEKDKTDPEEWFQNKLSGVHEQMKSLHAYSQGEEEDDSDEGI